MEADNNYIVYIHTNRHNGMKYIGITCRPTWRRWGHGSGYSKNARFYNAIIKYGWEAFDHEVVREGLSKQEAEAEEVRLIKFYDSTNRTKGYNLDNGGNGSNRVTNETRAKLSLSGQRRFAKQEEHQKLKEAAIRRNQDPEKFNKLCEGNRRRWQREGEREKISAGLESFYKKNPERKAEISRERKAFFEAHPEKKTTKRVKQLTADGVVIKVWNSQKEAADALDINFKSISAACCKNKSAGGYVWRLCDETGG